MNWIPVSERLPEKDVEVLVYDSNADSVYLDQWCDWWEAPVSFSSKTICVGEGWQTGEFESITHWMPKPAAPGVAPSPGASTYDTRQFSNLTNQAHGYGVGEVQRPVTATEDRVLRDATKRAAKVVDSGQLAPAARSQRMADVGYTRRKTGKSVGGLMREEDDASGVNLPDGAQR